MLVHTHLCYFAFVAVAVMVILCIAINRLLLKYLNAWRIAWFCDLELPSLLVSPFCRTLPSGSDLPTVSKERVNDCCVGASRTLLQLYRLYPCLSQWLSPWVKNTCFVMSFQCSYSTRKIVIILLKLFLVLLYVTMRAHTVGRVLIKVMPSRWCT